jgi:protein ImuB
MHWIALQPEPHGSADTLIDPSAALGWWALRYTPKVTRVGEVIVLEVSASARLWHGLPALMLHILESNKPVALVKFAHGATSLVAIAQLISTACGTKQEAASWPIDAFPLHTLAAALPHLGTLSRLGLRNWGQLRALPRDGLARRFGAALLDALDQAYGAKPEVYPWLTLPDVFDASLELSAQVESATALLFAARRLLAQLKVWLQLRHQGVLAFELIWLMDERKNTAHQGRLLLRTAKPTQDSHHLQRLLGEHLAHASLEAPAHTLRLRSVLTAKMTDQSASLLADDMHHGDSLNQTVERLSARLGASAVLQLQPHLDHRPERMQVWREVATQLIATHTESTRARTRKTFKQLNPDALHAKTGWAQTLLPTWLLDEPLKLAVVRQQPHYLGPLALLAGPQRLESGWWDGEQPALRDYYVARSYQSGLLWVYRERLLMAGTSNSPEPCWYLHGLFA